MLIQAANAHQMWIVYRHTLNGQSLYIGMCRYSEYFGFPDARRNSEWVKHVKRDTFLTTEILTIVQTQNEATAAQTAAITTYRPYCNLNAKPIEHTGKRIICVDNDATFDNATTAANYAGVTRQAMSQHLTGKIHTINGKHFRRI